MYHPELNEIQHLFFCITVSHNRMGIESMGNKRVHKGEHLISQQIFYDLVGRTRRFQQVVV